MSSFIITPADIGLPPKFDAFRPVQERALLQMTEAEARFIAPCVPTGGGKSLIYVAYALALGMRTAFLTSSKPLQDQLASEFGGIGLADLRGRQNYQCYLGGGYTCDEGRHARCPRSNSTQCLRRKAYEEAKASSLVVTNYPCWINTYLYGEGLGRFDLLVCDEAHAAPSEVCEAAAMTLTTREIYGLLRSSFPRSSEISQWRKWAKSITPSAVEERDRRQHSLNEQGGVPPVDVVREVGRLKNLVQKLEQLTFSTGPWCIDRLPHGVRLEPLWPTAYAEQYLFLKIPKIILTSATVRPKTMSLLGIPDAASTFLDYPGVFPRKNSPVYVIRKTPRVNRSMSEDKKREWLEMIDRIIDGRLDRKGILHSISYDRRNYLMAHSRHKAIMLTHESRNTMEVVRSFRRAPAPCLLVSPSVATGFDFPGAECSYQIIAKVPFPNLNQEVLKARDEVDPDYSNYITAQLLVQACGRGTRTPTDRCENFITDGVFRWWYRNNKHLLPYWFRNLIQYVNQPPRAGVISRNTAQIGTGYRSPAEVPDDDVPF